jgi:hypothetical protein
MYQIFVPSYTTCEAGIDVAIYNATQQHHRGKRAQFSENCVLQARDAHNTRPVERVSLFTNAGLGSLVSRNKESASRGLRTARMFKDMGTTLYRKSQLL